MGLVLASSVPSCSSVRVTKASPAPLRLTLSLLTTKGYINDPVIIFAPSSLDVPSSIWVDCRAHVILGQCNHLAMYQHAGQCLAREQLLLVPGLRRQGAECSQASVLHTKIIPGSQPCLGNMARIGAGTAQTTLACQATSSQLYTNGGPVPSSPGD